MQSSCLTRDNSGRKEKGNDVSVIILIWGFLRLSWRLLSGRNSVVTQILTCVTLFGKGSQTPQWWNAEFSECVSTSATAQKQNIWLECCHSCCDGVLLSVSANARTQRHGLRMDLFPGVGFSSLLTLGFCLPWLWYRGLPMSRQSPSAKARRRKPGPPDIVQCK